MASLLSQSLRRIVSTVGNDRPTSIAKGYRNARIVSVCARKGGVGKTTTAVNLAAGYALRGKSVLLVDMDAQGHCTTALSSELRGMAAGSLSEVLLGRRRDVQEIALRTSVPNLYITVGDKELSSAEGVMAGKIGKEFLLRKCLKVARTHYDLIVIDCPPTLGNLTINALMASDYLLVPCDMSVLALEGVDDIFETVETLSDTLNHDLGILGVLRTRYDSRNKSVNECVEPALASRYGRTLLDTRIPVNTRLAQAQAAGKPIARFDEACRGAVAYDELLDEVAGSLGF